MPTSLYIYYLSRSWVDKFKLPALSVRGDARRAYRATARNSTGRVHNERATIADRRGAGRKVPAEALLMPGRPDSRGGSGRCRSDIGHRRKAYARPWMRATASSVVHNALAMKRKLMRAAR